MLNGQPMEIPPAEGSGLDAFDIALFAASCDDLATNRRFAAALELDYVVLSDPEKKVAEAYGVVHAERSVPERWTFIIGTDGNILDVMTEVDSSAAGVQLAKRLEELGIEHR
jgi:peroxiredoxin Q/BCP